MPVLTPPRAPPLVTIRSRVIDRIQHAYTIHDMRKHAFTVQLPQKKTLDPSEHRACDDVNAVCSSDFSDPLTKTTIVSFEHEFDASKMAKLLESHKAINHEWPSTVFDNDFSLHLVTNSIAVNSELCVTNWEFDCLREYCINHIIDLMYIKGIEDNGSKLIIKSDLFRLDMTSTFYASKFNEMLLK